MKSPFGARRWSRPILALGVAMFLVSHVEGQQGPQAFMSVVDAGGAPIADLQVGEVGFKVGEVQCQAVKLEPINWPMKLSVLVDNSKAAADILTDLRAGLRGFFSEIPEGVELSLLTFSPQPRWVVRPTTDRSSLVKGVDLLAPDNGAAKFVDSLVEAADRITKDKPEHFPVLLAIATDGPETSDASERNINRMLMQMSARPVTVHLIMLNRRLGSTGNSTMQFDVGTILTKGTGGRYEGINSGTRFSTLLSEYAKQIAQSHARQSHQYRVSCDRWAAALPAQQTMTIGATRPGTKVTLTANGRLP